MTQKHTQGEWTLCRRTYNNELIGWHITGEKHGSLVPLAECNDFHQQNADEMEANARLIAACPILYEYALKQSLNGCIEAKLMLASLGLN